MKRKFTQRILKKAVNKIKISEVHIRFRFVYIKVNDKHSLSAVMQLQ